MTIGCEAKQGEAGGIPKSSSLAPPDFNVNTSPGRTRFGPSRRNFVANAVATGLSYDPVPAPQLHIPAPLLTPEIAPHSRARLVCSALLSTET